MRFKVITNMEVQTSEGSTTLKEGQVIKLSEEEAISLINEGKITPIEKVAYKVYSEVLGCYLWVVSDDKDREAVGLLRASQGITKATYTADEIKEIKKLPKEALKVIHRVKKVFLMSTVEEITNKVNQVN